VSGVGNFGSGTCPATTVNPQGQCRFFGTSAAAPHTAGCDALVRDLIGATAAPATVRAKLAATAQDLGPPGEDSTNGAGIVDCFLALGPPKTLCQPRTVFTDPGVCTAAGVSINNGSFDPDGGPVTLSQTPPGPYPLGATSVTLTATDSDGLFGTCSAVITVQDNQPPVLSNVPAPITVECTAPAGTPVTVPLPTATDNCTIVTVVSDAPAVFPLGKTTVTFTATDGSGNTAKTTTTVMVIDTTPPTIKSVTATPNVLWPPNHKMVPVSATVDVSDICDLTPTCKIVSVTSNEPVEDKGDGKTAPDWQIVGDLSVNLRAERSGTGNGRVYTLAVQCTDASNNSSTARTTVSVPHNR
jgi:hypothetical protein